MEKLTQRDNMISAIFNGPLSGCCGSSSCFSRAVSRSEADPLADVEAEPSAWLVVSFVRAAWVSGSWTAILMLGMGSRAPILADSEAAIAVWREGEGERGGSSHVRRVCLMGGQVCV